MDRLDGQPSKVTETVAEAVEIGLAAYVAGSLPRPLHALFESHLAISPTHRPLVEQLECVAGYLLDCEAPADIDGREAILARIFATEAEPETTSELSCPWPQPVPTPISHLLHLGGNTFTWRDFPAGRNNCAHGMIDGHEVRIGCAKPGIAIPDHTHDGDEFLLVVSGDIVTEAGELRAGDIGFHPGGMPHSGKVVGSDDCVYFVVVAPGIVVPTELTTAGD